MDNQKNSYDSIVIGSGQGGNPLAQGLAKRGERVALIERRVLGGTCVNTGCTPTKTYVATAQVAHYVRNAERWGVQPSDARVDMQAVLRRKNQIVTRMRGGWETTFNDNAHVDVQRGSARFLRPDTVEVNGAQMTANRFFIDTGCTPAIPQIQGLDAVNYLTNESILELTEVPTRLLVLGAGYIGLEFAQVFHRFGSQVTVIGNSKQILPQEDQDVATMLQSSLASEGIRFAMPESARSVRKTASGELEIITHSGASYTGSHLLLAVGRTPNTLDLGLENAGVATDERGYIRVNDKLETTAPNIWALGDVKGGPAFTHISYNDYQIIFGNLFEGKSLSVAERLVPYCVFTDPQLGRVGMTEKQAQAQGRAIKLGKVEMSRVARAIERAETAGMMKIVVDANTDCVLGAAILAAEGGELVQILSTLMLAHQPYTLLKGAIYIHPTLAEGFFSLLESVQ